MMLEQNDNVVYFAKEDKIIIFLIRVIFDTMVTNVDPFFKLTAML